jgi:hypothetical protein
MTFNCCRLCHGDQTTTYLTAEDSLTHCVQCALTFAVYPQTKVKYDQQYVAERYDKYDTTDRMSSLRLRLVEQVLYTQETLPDYQGRFGVKRGPLLDVGYGNGSFIRRCLAEKWDAFGFDVNPTQYQGVRSLPWVQCIAPGLRFRDGRWRVVSFFDSLEHFETLEEVRRLVEVTDWLVISAPLPPPSFPQDQAWKHYRPGEHHWAFHQPWTFERIFRTETAQARVAYVGTPEDSIRGKLLDGSDNIQTVILKTRR